MTASKPSESPFRADAVLDSTPALTSGRGWEAAIARGSEWLNPILVKEARQALKSKQFVVTFALVLLAGWGWSLMGVAMLLPGVYYAPGGRFMLSGYFVVLSIPVLVNVPFAAFRSLAAEREDGTFELLSITTLSARQIVTGKLGSAILQMVVYYSALAPSIAFTYLLRGIDIITILFLLFYTFVASMVLSSFGLVVATASKARHWQTLLSVLLVILLLLATYIWVGAFLSIMVYNSNAAFDDIDFWLTQAAIVTFCISFSVLFVMLAAAQITFPSENRSTRVRIALLAQQVLWIGWITFFWLRSEETEFLLVETIIGGLYWFLVGSFLIGEEGRLSPRVQRSLPQSFLGRVLFTWFNPGSGTGYTFAVTNMLALVALIVVAGTITEAAGLGGMAGTRWDWLTFALLAGAYVVAYLGLGRLCIVLLRQIGQVTMLLSVLLNVFMALMGIALPLFGQAWLEGYQSMTYSSLQATNWWWTLQEVSDNSLPSFVVPVGVMTTAGLMFLLNLIFTTVEVEQVRRATPKRVLDDERELHPDLRPTKPHSPWDEEVRSPS